MTREAVDSNELWIWFADNGNIRKWSRKPFAEGTRYVATSSGSECICPKCGIRHGGRSDGNPGF